MKKYFIAFLALFICAQDIIAQKDTSVYAYQKPLFDFEYQKPIFILEAEQLSNQRRFLRSSVLTGYREGVTPTNGPYGYKVSRFDDLITGTTKIAMYNLSIAEMLNQFPVNPHRVVLEVKDPSKYLYKPEYGVKDAWLRKNGYCFEFTMPIGLASGSDPGASVLLWQQEVRDLFGVSVSREWRKVKALVLVRTSKADKIKSKGIGKGEYDLKGHYNNVPIDRIGHVFNHDLEMLPFVDGTNYKEMVDLDLQIKDWKNLTEVRKALQRYDLDLREEMREVKDVLVIQEIGWKK